MLEVNNFSAIRISLASPDQIREWSKGEVTKPETINYRTLKPEKDGLFDERIFGPTKDWECYCGKYKRIRYKGIICDKCGVEVTRSKVRRERMGHIKLASPVSHIWYFKGTPSRLGILLDVSPRNLERILYFALYVVTRVDEQEREKVLARIEEEMNERIARAGEAVETKRAELTEAIAEKRAEVDSEHESEIRRHDERFAARSEELAGAAQQIEASLKAGGKTVAEEIVFTPTGEVVAHAGDPTKGALTALRTAVKAEVEAIDADVKEAKARANERRETATADLTGGIDEALTAERTQVSRETDDARLAARSARTQIAEIKVMQTLTESEFRSLTEQYGRLFDAGMGAEAIKKIIEQIDLDDLAQRLHVEMRQTSGQRRKKAIKRLRLIEAFRKSGARPEWMILSTLPVIPPDLRPMVQLDGGRFATSDLNDLYRRVINRNNRLSRLLDLEAPEIIIRNEKRMLQEACDALIDNGRRGRAIAGTGNHRLKSLSDMLKGKQGRFRQNLLGKRVDYSGRSVIVVGPELKLHQCGLPKKMALELFKPFVMRRLVDQALAQNIKSAKRMVERARPQVWDVLEEVIGEHPVMLNRAPTLHRLGIQAFEPVLVEGKAIQIHPLVCTAFNADFDGDQMAVHVPLSAEAQAEARVLMLSSNNILKPADGKPVVAPTQDMVLGCYYLTMEKETTENKAPTRIFADEDEALYAHELSARGLSTASGRVTDGDGNLDSRAGKPVQSHGQGKLELHEPIEVVVSGWDEASGELRPMSVRTTVGRIIFNQIVPDRLRFTELTNREMRRTDLKRLVDECYRLLGPADTAHLVDGIKDVGFKFATRGGMTIGLWDIVTPPQKAKSLKAADDQVGDIDKQFQRGLITEEERYEQVVELWKRTTDSISAAMMAQLPEDNALRMMTDSGARGNKGNIGQLGAMRGLMADPSGRIIDVPVRSNFREGMSVLEYFISTHGARKGLADTALRTADSGYLTRRLVDVAQDVITREEDCGTEEGSWIIRSESSDEKGAFQKRLVGRLAAAPLPDPRVKAKKGEEPTVLADRNELITEEQAERIDLAGI